MIPYLKKKYLEEIVPSLQKKLGYNSPMQVPKLLAIHINRGLASAKSNAKLIERLTEELTIITGQKAVPTVARLSISNFKLRAGMKVGAHVTLRGNIMYEFAFRFFNFALPRGRDFKGINEKSFDGRGNYTCGIKEQIIFLEIDVGKVDEIGGMTITFVTSAKTNKEGYQLLLGLGAPFSDMHKHK